MYSAILALVSALSFLQLAQLAKAGIFVLKPEADSTCHGGQPCTIEWIDDGVAPLLSAAGVCTFGLYTGHMQLVQAIAPTDVSKTHSVTFTLSYVGIISTIAKTNSSDPDVPYSAFSPFFKLDQMTGSFDSPLPEATSTIPIPSSLAHFASASGTHVSTSATTLSTITVGTLSTSLPPLPTPTTTISTSKASSTLTSQARLTTSTISSTSPVTLPPTTVASGIASSVSPVPTTSTNGAFKTRLPSSPQLDTG
ncbi:hypothetical protein H0H92_005324 [Tricholoma furcatifolium]|nr:hypothetical protein H0H92_005324 [Tricholoma furcatifolium]